MENLKENLWKELDKLDRKDGINPGDLELAHVLTDTLKNIDKICMLEERAGYSEAGDDGRGSSYANRGQHWVRGHYSRDGGMGYSSRRDSRGRYSRDDGRSEMMEHLEMALDSASEQDREKVKRFIRQLENA